jgi:hypothetical protein
MCVHYGQQVSESTSSSGDSKPHVSRLTSHVPRPTPQNLTPQSLKPQTSNLEPQASELLAAHKLIDQVRWHQKHEKREDVETRVDEDGRT